MNRNMGERFSPAAPDNIEGSASRSSGTSSLPVGTIDAAGAASAFVSSTSAATLCPIDSACCRSQATSTRARRADARHRSPPAPAAPVDERDQFAKRAQALRAQACGNYRPEPLPDRMTGDRHCGRQFRGLFDHLQRRAGEPRAVVLRDLAAQINSAFPAMPVLRHPTYLRRSHESSSPQGTTGRAPEPEKDAVMRSARMLSEPSSVGRSVTIVANCESK